MPSYCALLTIYHLICDAPVVWVDLEPPLLQGVAEVLPKEESRVLGFRKDILVVLLRLPVFLFP